MYTSRNPIPAADLFGPPRHGRTLKRLTHGDRLYLTDGSVSVLAHLVDPDGWGVAAGEVNLDGNENYTTPDREPGQFTGYMKPAVLGRLTRLGIQVRESDRLGIVHLYYLGEHVGWSATSGEGSGIRLVDVAEVEGIADLIASLPPGTHPWQVATLVLNATTWKEGDQ